MSLLTGKRADLNLARRRTGHDRLVLLTTPHDRDLVAAVRASEDQVEAGERLEVIEIDDDDPLHLMAEIAMLLDRYRDAEIVLNAAGGSGALHAAMLHTAFARGIETWFFQEGHAERLPVLHGLEPADRVTDNERRVLLGLPPEGATSRYLAETLIHPRERVEAAFRGLKKKGLVRLEAPSGITHATPTSGGIHVREHLAAQAKRQRRIRADPVPPGPGISASSAAT